jgi:dTDP-4-dehydrorhamnose 3,5-epimerase
MVKIDTGFEGLYLLRPSIHKDDRGFFMESYSKKAFAQLGIHTEFVQDNHSKSVKNTLRGLHYQAWPQGQDKLIRCVKGEIMDVVVDIRPKSSTYLQHLKILLSETNCNQLHICKGMLHGFLVLSDVAEVQYKCSWYYEPELEKGYAWNDPAFNIDWGITNPILSERDRSNPCYNR